MLSVKEKVAYGLGDTASNIVFQTVMLFLAFFYTDIFGISPAVVGTMFIAGGYRGHHYFSGDWSHAARAMVA